MDTLSAELPNRFLSQKPKVSSKGLKALDAPQWHRLSYCDSNYYVLCQSTHLRLCVRNQSCWDETKPQNNYIKGKETQTVQAKETKLMGSQNRKRERKLKSHQVGMKEDLLITAVTWWIHRCVSAPQLTKKVTGSIALQQACIYLRG